MKFNKMITTVDSHTEGQPTRVIISGFPNIPGKTMSERKEYVKKNLDHLRTAILHEPRGVVSSFGVIMTPPVTDKAAFGVIWMEGGDKKEMRYIDMCGHGTIGVAATAVEMGIVEMHEPVTEISYDTPAGLVQAKVKVDDGKIRSVTVQNVPAFLYTTKMISVPEMGEIQVDIAFGGNNYAIINAVDLGIGTTTSDIKNARNIFEQVLAAIRAQVSVQHPERPHIKGVLSLLINDKPNNPKATVKNIYADDVGGIDRSPCGTGTSARMATCYAKGKLALGETFITESIIGSLFNGKLIREEKVGDIQAVVPEITGRAYITGLHQFMIDEEDPFKYGFLL